MTVTGPADLDPCPYCGGTCGVQPVINTLPKVQGWSCEECGTNWWIGVVNPRPYLDYLAGLVDLAAARSRLRQVIALADEAPALPDDQLRVRLAHLATQWGRRA
ncbi:MAG: hypothetical protein JOZ09_09635 [Pseudonocardiales bacterium]|nr:hypothetical protein [Pseudonocardiales bacterium]